MIAVSNILFALLLAQGTYAACVGTISSLDDVAGAITCTTININSFTVPAGKTFSLALADKTTVNLLGDITFGTKNWAGPLFQVTGKDIIFKGNGHTFNGNGPFYWDGLGGNGGVTKPRPMMKIKISGIFDNVKVLNSPAHTYSVSTPAYLTMSKLVIDNSLGALPNANSGGQAAGHNTDGFDVGTNNLLITDSVITNQDDCIAINSGNNITFQRNTCTGGHGVSIGSIDTGDVVSNIRILDNTIINNDQALRIKTIATATGATVTNVTYSGNVSRGSKRFGILIDQSYPSTVGSPGNGVVVSNIIFSGKNTIAVNSTAQRAVVNCGKGSCTGTWNWSGLTTSGGTAGKVVNMTGITGYTFS